MVRAKLRLRKNRPPLSPFESRQTVRVSEAALEGRAVRIVALEVIGVDLDTRQQASCSEAHDRPVVSGSAATTRLPAVPHVPRAAGHDHVVLRRRSACRSRRARGRRSGCSQGRLRGRRGPRAASPPGRLRTRESEQRLRPGRCSSGGVRPARSRRSGSSCDNCPAEPTRQGSSSMARPAGPLWTPRRALTDRSPRSSNARDCCRRNGSYRRRRRQSARASRARPRTSHDREIAAGVIPTHPSTCHARCNFPGMKIAASGFNRLARGAKKSSLDARARPPTRAEARSASRVNAGVSSCSLAGGPAVFVEFGMLTHSSYGKERVRLVQVLRRSDLHDLRDLTIAVRFEGDYDTSYTDGDNSAVLPTDTMKNTVYALAATEPVQEPESFGQRLARHFLTAERSPDACDRRPRRASLGTHRARRAPARQCLRASWP